MKIETRMSQKEYTQLLFMRTYKRPLIIILTVFNLWLVGTGLVYFFGMTDLFEQPPYNLFFIGLAISIYFPVSVYFRSKRMYKSNARLQETITYEFSGDRLIIQGESFTSDRDLNKVYRIEEFGKWFLIYENTNVANIIPKESLTTDEINELRTIFRNLHLVKVVKLKK